eukprot:6311889-Pyramimonas_sp.AAC.1
MEAERERGHVEQVAAEREGRHALVPTTYWVLKLAQVNLLELAMAQPVVGDGQVEVHHRIGSCPIDLGDACIRAQIEEQAG